MSAYLECIVFVCKRLHQSTLDGDLVEELSEKTLAESIATTWIGRVLAEVMQGRFAGKLSDNSAGMLIGNSIKKLEQVNPGKFFMSVGPLLLTLIHSQF